MRILLLISICLLLSDHADARIIVTGKHQAFKTIQSALATALPGDTLHVMPGVYREKNIKIQKPITLLGFGWPVLDGEFKYENISVMSSDVHIEGFAIIRSGVSSIEDFAGIKIYNQRRVVIRKNIFQETFFGIYCQYAANCTIEGNMLRAYYEQEQQSGNGIHCWKSDSLLIQGNTIMGHRDGIYFEFVTHSSIRNNHSEGNLRYGLHFMFSDQDEYTGNMFKNNGAGVAVMFTKKVRMLDNQFVENWGDGSYGLLLKEISDGYISGNKFDRNTVGIFMEGSNRITLEHNQFKKNGWAMKLLANCTDVDVRTNNFISNTFDVGTNGSLVLNKITGNYWDKYEGYDLDRNKKGDIPYRPVSLYAMIVEQNPSAMILFRSFMAGLLDRTEKIIPTITPENLKDYEPYMKPLPL